MNRVALQAAKLNNGNGSSIALRPTLSRQNSTSSQSKIPVNNPEAAKWKYKCEEVEQKRKSLLTEKEKLFRLANDFEKKYHDVLTKNELLETELFEKNEELAKLTTASKSLYQLYETLRNQYELEVGAMSSALKDASQWYKENKALKRKTLLLQDSIDAADGIDEGVDTCESSNESNLDKTIKQLSSELAELQMEVENLKQTEFQLNEQNLQLIDELNLERTKNITLTADFKRIQKENEQILRVSDMLKKDLELTKQLEEDQRNNMVTLRQEANEYKVERNILAHQSTLMSQNINFADLPLLQEIETLKRTLEAERLKHEEDLNNLQDKLEDLQSNSHTEILEERLKLTESELQNALQRAEKAEESLRKPPIPPPPPPPPTVPLRVKRKSKINVLDIAETIGVQPEDKRPAPPTATGVNEDIINAIKEGKFTLKKTKGGSATSKKDKDTPNAVSEILNILGTLRRTAKKRQSVALPD